MTHNKSIRILHTSDWHLGRTLYKNRRFDEFEKLLSWMTTTIREHNVDVLLLAGDLFDTTTPGTTTQTLYFSFLKELQHSGCRHVVITGGNHDSPTLLDAPGELLRLFNIHVVGSASANPADEVIVLCNQAHEPEMIVCAVPYLRDRDLRTAESGESYEDKATKLLQGIRLHYQSVAAAAQAKLAEYNTSLPVVAMGHLFCAGGRVAAGDGVREHTVGSLSQVPLDIFDPLFNYVALGHLHVPQEVANHEHIRYSGSPIPIGFGEANQQKSVVIVDFNHNSDPEITLLPIPRFQELRQIEGTWKNISDELIRLSATNTSIWLEITYTGTEIIADLQARINALIANTAIEVLRINNRQAATHSITINSTTENLEDLNLTEVFERCMTARNIPPEQQQDLMRCYQELLQELDEQDPLHENREATP